MCCGAAILEFLRREMMRKAALMVTISVLCFAGVTLPIASLAEEGVFEVRAISVNSVTYRSGKVNKGSGGDQVVYSVNIPKKTITRTAVYNKGNPPIGGIQSDSSVYQIIHDEPKDSSSGQRIIKGFGRVGAVDGYETVVIGDTFVITSRSTSDYFALWYYKREELLNPELLKSTGK